MLNKLWNCGVRLRDKRRDADHVSSAYWSWVRMPQPCFKLSHVNFEQVGICHQIPAILPSKAWPGCLGMQRRVRSGGFWSFIAERKPHGSPSPLTEWRVHNSPGMQLKSLLVYLYYLITVLKCLKPDPCVGLHKSGLPALWVMWHCDCLFYTIILMAPFSNFSFEATTCQPQDHPPVSFKPWVSGLKIFLFTGFP